MLGMDTKREELMYKFLRRAVTERTSWDGVILIGICGSVILFGGLAKMLAWVGLAYGIWTLAKPE